MTRLRGILINASALPTMFPLFLHRSRSFIHSACNPFFCTGYAPDSFLRRPGIQRHQELVRTGGCGNCAFQHNVLCGNPFPTQVIVHTSTWTERGTLKGTSSKHPSSLLNS